MAAKAAVAAVAAGDSPPAARRAQSLGSGFIVDPAGYVVTNNHVIEGADVVSVTLQDNTVLKARSSAVTRAATSRC